MAKVVQMDDGTLAWYCPACKCDHVSNGSWQFNGDFGNKPTFSPSFLVRTGHHVPSHTGDCWCTHYERHPDKPKTFACTICHTFVTNGQIQYLSDCTHEYAGKTVEMEEPVHE